MRMTKRVMIVLIAALSLLVFPAAASAIEFEPYQAYPTGSWPMSVAIGDVTSDGRNDVLMTTETYADSENDFKLSVYEQQPDRTLVPRRIPTRGQYSDHLGFAIGDLNGDGRNDVALATRVGVEVFFQSSAGQLEAGQLIAGSPERSSHVLVFDADGDRDNDIVVSAVAGILLLTNDGSGTFTSSSIAGPSFQRELEQGDVSGDGKPDIVSLDFFVIKIFVRTASGYASPISIPAPRNQGSPNGIAVGDVTGDGRADVIVARSDFLTVAPGNSVFPQLPGGGISPTPVAYPSASDLSLVESADLDRDGLRDVVALQDGDGVAVFLQQASGALGAPSVFPVSSYNLYLKGMALGDVNSDRAPDVAIADHNEGLLILRQVRANRPPDCSGVAGTPSELLFAHGAFATASLAGATDPDGDPVTLTVTGVAQDERLTGPGDKTAPDAALGASSREVSLRGERAPNGDGRIYRITFSADDGLGGSCQGVAVVSVRRHEKRPAVDSGAAF